MLFYKTSFHRNADKSSVSRQNRMRSASAYWGQGKALTVVKGCQRTSAVGKEVTEQAPARYF